MAVSQIVAKKGGIYSGREGGVDYGRVAYRCLKGGYIQRRRGRFWEGRIDV